MTFAGMVADNGQVTAAEKAGEYSQNASWTHVPQASLQMPAHRFLMGAGFNLFSSLPYAASRFESSDWRENIRRLLREQKFDLVVCDFLFPAVSLPWDEKARSSIPWVIFQHNVESMIWLRRAENKRGLVSFYWRSQWRRMKKHEVEMCSKFDGIITVSDKDSSVFREDLDLSNVLGTAPTGVDLEYFQALPRTTSSVSTVMFMGSMDWYANVDGVNWFVEAVWPLIQREMPQARFVIVGRKPPAEIQALAGTGKNIEVTGTVPDVRPYLRGADVIVVPLRIGGGTRLKIYEAMAAEVPVVSTSVGAEGLDVKDGRHVLLADTAEDTAAKVLQVLRNPALGTELATHALEEVARPCSWAASAQIFEEFCAGLIQKRSQS
ncbi:glycosyltransferase [Prosthecobacter sp.]|uniref:glycosyltransferase n=1 Tax=Prosthecobacter sp. TaxID=1965333 RepID=UPI003784C765